MMSKQAKEELQGIACMVALAAVLLLTNYIIPFV